jgi:hypothetical protein
MTEAADESGRREAEAGPGLTLGVDTLMVAVALIGVILAVGRENPGLGIATFSILGLALIRTTRRIGRRGAAGRPMTQGEKASDLLVSIGIVLVIGLVPPIVFALISLAGWWIASAVGEVRGIGGVDNDLFVGAAFVFVAFTTALLAAASVASRLWRDLKTGPEEAPRTDADRRVNPDE